MERDWKVWQDRQVAENFVTNRRRELLGAEAQIETLLQLVQRAQIAEGTVLDLGCGDGILLHAILTTYPHLTGVALDGSPPMIAKARERFAGSENVVFALADFNDPGWREALPCREFAAVVSGFAIHHSEDARKRELYQEIFDLLRPGGVFVNVEHVASVSSFGEMLSDYAMIGHACRVREGRGEATDFEAMLAAHRGRSDKAANRLTLTETQLQWLRDIGFAEVDCYWKHYELAVLAGYKP